jgi:hypothetical protein
MKFKTASDRRDFAYSCLTPEVRRLYTGAINDSNVQVLAERQRYAQQYSFADDDRRGMSGEIRAKLFRNLRTAFASFGYSKFRNVNGYFYHQLHKSHLIRIVKSEIFDTPIRTPSVLEVYHNPELPLVYEDDEEVDPAFGDLFPLQGRFAVREDNTISEFCFVDQEGDAVYSSESLDLSLRVVSLFNDEPKNAKKNPFTWKGDNNRNDKSGLGES